MKTFVQDVELYATEKARKAKRVVTDKVDTAFVALAEAGPLKNHLKYNKRTNGEVNEIPDEQKDTKVQFTRRRSASSELSYTYEKHAAIEGIRDNSIFEFTEPTSESEELHLNLSLREEFLENEQTEPYFQQADLIKKSPNLASAAADVFFTSFGLNPSSQALQRVLAARKGAWERGVNLSTKSSQSGFGSKGKVGKMSVKVKSVECAKASFKAFFIVEVGDSKFKSPTIFPDTNGIFTWEIGLEFPIDDIFGDLRFRFYKSHIVSDSLIGQVLMPISEFMPKFGARFEHEAPASISGLFELFPLPPSCTKFTPAFENISTSGMVRPKSSLGKVHLEFVLKFAPNLSLWSFYLESTPRLRRNKSSDFVALNTSIPSDISEDYYKIIRHVERIKTASSKLFQPIYFIFQVYMDIVCWKNPLNSLAVASFTVAYCLVSNPDSFPLNLTIIDGILYSLLWLPMINLAFVAMISLKNYWRRNEFKPLIWNDETVDKDAHLSQLQKLLKISHVVHNIEIRLGNVADTLEKILNTFTWTDEIATSLSLVLVVAGMTLFIVFAILLLMLPRHWLSTWFWSIPFLIGVSRKLVPLLPRANRKRATRFGEKSSWISLSTLWQLIPTDDERAHKAICKMQVVEILEPKPSSDPKLEEDSTTTEDHSTDS